MRIRTIKPEFWKHEELSELPEAVHMLAATLLNYADDEGYFNANPQLIKAACFPLREPSVSVHDGLTALSHIGYLKLGTSKDGKRYGCIVTFSEHQRINRKLPSKIKSIEIVWDGSVRTHTQLTESSHLEGNGKEGKGKEDAAPNGAHDSKGDPVIAERELFTRGKQVLGPSSGGMISKLLKAKGGNVASARGIIEFASQKQNPREYVARATIGPEKSEVLDSFGNRYPDGII